MRWDCRKSLSSSTRRAESFLPNRYRPKPAIKCACLQTSSSSAFLAASAQRHHQALQDSLLFAQAALSAVTCAHDRMQGFPSRSGAQAGMQHSGLGSGRGNLPPGQQPGGGVLDMAVAAQHREVAALRDQMAVLRHEMTAMRQGSTGATALQPQHKVLRAQHFLSHALT